MNVTKNSWWCEHSINRDFPVDIHRSEHQRLGTVIECHWHENFELLYFEKGEAIIYCNSRPIRVGPGELIIINSNDLHYGENVSPQLVYYVVEFDLSFIHSNKIDLCQTKYMTPLVQNRILFRNQIDQNNELLEEVRHLINEYYRQELGYELAVKAYIYRILVLLLRFYGEQTISESEKDRQRSNLSRLSPVLEYMDCYYTEKLSLEQLSSMANMSPHYFCRLFKHLTGKSPTEYINHLRLNKAVALLLESNLNITEIAMAVGFNDSNYFSRLFKKYKQVPPSKLLK
ncbi:AraC family transcriptional regulator [Sporomusa sp.]|jgi:AraC-like DNA-binding protein|uniref:helix-turn-helix domain-containing protein n=1 Tax=Sporomusa sp. TaxID=2078658 RepID=UPI002CDCFFC5|nr:AraC family transcriptional regulator [Sporomusa sp.]MDF2874070.1 transcriptional regulator, AraC family [Sporomusa sp.]HWR10132.1 AraC family transcriptional regulator [Sporomusa sp.]